MVFVETLARAASCLICIVTSLFFHSKPSSGWNVKGNVNQSLRALIGDFYITLTKEIIRAMAIATHAITLKIIFLCLLIFELLAWRRPTFRHCGVDATAFARQSRWVKRLGSPAD